MNLRSRLLPAALLFVGAAGLSLWLFRTNAPQDVTPQGASSSSVPPVSGGGAAHSPAAKLAQQVSEAERRVQATREGQLAGTRVNRTQVVVTVNGTPITGAKLMGWRARDGEGMDVSAESLQALTERAIQRELVTQAARDRNLELTAAQQGQLKDVRAQAMERGETDPGRLDFEQEEARAQLLLKAMLDKDGAPPEFAGEAEVDRYYKEHADDFGALPADPAARDAARKKINIQIRETLYGEFHERYQERVREFLKALRDKATITR